ncbi:MAG: hypothetical protein QM664_05680 [Flavihumibacter sp.]
MFLFFRKAWVPTGCVLATHVATLWPRNQMPDEHIDWLPHADKWVHSAAFFGVVFSVFAWLLLNGKINPQKKGGWGILLAVLATLDGLLVELLQRTASINRDYDLADALADSLGAFTGLLAVIWFYRMFWAKKKPL